MNDDACVCVCMCASVCGREEGGVCVCMCVGGVGVCMFVFHKCL